MLGMRSTRPRSWAPTTPESVGSWWLVIERAQAVPLTLVVDVVEEGGGEGQDGEVERLGDLGQLRGSRVNLSEEDGQGQGEGRGGDGLDGREEVGAKGGVARAVEEDVVR